MAFPFTNGRASAGPRRMGNGKPHHGSKADARIIRRDYVGDPPSGVQDALNALKDDLLPLLAAYRIGVLSCPVPLR